MVNNRLGAICGMALSVLSVQVSGASTDVPAPVGAEYQGGYFAITNLPSSRLEAEAGVTRSVNVPLFRTGTEVAKNFIEVSTSSELISVDWAEGEQEQVIALGIPESLKSGDVIELTLKTDDSETVKSQTAVNIVDVRANSVKNPHWIGENTAETLPFGEWTFDFDVAMEKAKNEGGQILAIFSGTLWCPYCEGIEKSLLADPELKQWAEDTKTVFVLFDQPRKDMTAPQLLSYEELSGVSGASYLSRKGVDAASAKEVIARTYKYSTQEWLAKETTATRLGNPTLLLITADGKLAARYNASRDDTKVYPTAENIARLNELLLLIDDKEEDNYFSTTPLTFTPGTSATETLQVNDNTDIFKLVGIPEDDVDYVFTATAGEGENSDRKITAAEVNMDGVRYVKVVGPYTSRTDAYGRNTTLTYTLTSSVLLNPTETLREFAGSDETFFINFENGKTYKLDGFDASSFPASLKSGAKAGVYFASESGTFSVKKSEEKVTYQIWNPDEDTGTEPAWNETNAPALEKAEYDFTIYTGFACDYDVPVCNVSPDAKVTVVKTGGKLPSGIKQKYRNVNGRSVVNLAGKPSQAGTYEYRLAVRVRNAPGTVTGPETVIRVNVVSPGSIDPSDKNYNPFVGKALNASVPVYGNANGAKVLGGILDVTVNANNRITAKLTSAKSGTQSFSGSWQELNNGTACGTFVTRSGAMLDLSLAKSGRLIASIRNAQTDIGDEFASDEDGVSVSPADGAFASYAGYYTVTMPLDASSLKQGGETVPTGTGYLTFKMNTSQFKKSGKVSYSGKCADGTSVSGTANLVSGAYADGSAQLCIFKRASKATLGLVLKVRANAAEEYMENPMSILPDPDVTPFWFSSKFGTLPLQVYGGYYDPGMDLLGCCDESYETTEFKIDCLLDYFKTSEKFGNVISALDANVSVGERSFTVQNFGNMKVTMRLQKKTGVAKGSFLLPFEKGNVKVSFEGVLLPLWVDCGCMDYEEPIIERPFFSGFATYSDKVDGISTKRGFAVDLTPVFTAE